MCLLTSSDNSLRYLAPATSTEQHCTDISNRSRPFHDMVTRSNSYPERRITGLHSSVGASPFLHSSSLDLSQRDLVTATDPDGNCVHPVPNARHVRQLDKVLHIRSLDSHSDSFSNLRAVLLQLRDSLSAETTTAGNVKVTPASSAVCGTHYGTAGCQQHTKNMQGVGACRSCETPYRSHYGTDSKRRPERISLPTFCLGDCHHDELAARSSGTELRCRLASSLRHRASVKFADEFGLNLNTFVMIPSRFQRTGSPIPRPAAIVDEAPLKSCGSGPKTCSPSKYLEQSGDYQSVVKPSNDNGKLSDNDVLSLCLKHQPTNKVESNAATDEAASPKTSTPSASAASVGNCDVPVEIMEPQFRLCFDQPFANQERFHARLSSQKICLENVRVEDWTLGGNPPSWSQPPQACIPILVAANSVMLCSIRVSNVHPEKHVFARCTDNDWLTYTDLPAQHVGKTDSLGYAHDRFCFAVRRPLYTSNFRPPSVSEGPAQVAVEFAVCYQVAGGTYWDNNDGANYRIEWF